MSFFFFLFFFSTRVFSAFFLHFSLSFSFFGLAFPSLFLIFAPSCFSHNDNSYARVAARIEIEVELESEVPAASITSELSRLQALREAESAAAAGAAAADEVERLLRGP